MVKAIFLSHPLNPEAPGYGGKKAFGQTQASSIAHGDSSNSSTWSFSNHVGTHVDAPFHFSDAGKKVDEYEASFWVFAQPVLIEIQVQPGELIGVGPWCEGIDKNCDLLILRTGFEAFRDQEKYWNNGPGLSDGLGAWLRTERPLLRALGMDILSATSWCKRPEGRAAHRSFLDPGRPGNPILLIEDMALKKLTASPRRVTIAPLRVTGADGAPVTVIAEP